MRQGFVKAAAVTPKIKVADTKYNAELILDMMKESTRQGAKIVVFPELCLTGYTCQDLFLQERLLQGAKDALMKLVKESASLDAIFFVGLPFEILGKLYNVAAVFSHGEVLGLVPKSYLPNYNEFYEARHFVSGAELATEVVLPDGSCVPADRDLLFVCEQMPKLRTDRQRQLPQGTGKWPVCTSSCGIYLCVSGRGRVYTGSGVLRAQHHCGKRTDSCGIQAFWTWHPVFGD